jgi:ABC-type multidrug transport system fused ATPase/permease subunit
MTEFSMDVEGWLFCILGILAFLLNVMIFIRSSNVLMINSNGEDQRFLCFKKEFSLYYLSKLDQSVFKFLCIESILMIVYGVDHRGFRGIYSKTMILSIHTFLLIIMGNLLMCCFFAGFRLLMSEISSQDKTFENHDKLLNKAEFISHFALILVNILSLVLSIQLNREKFFLISFCHIAGSLFLGFLGCLYIFIRVQRQSSSSSADKVQDDLNPTIIRLNRKKIQILKMKALFCSLFIFSVLVVTLFIGIQNIIENWNSQVDKVDDFDHNPQILTILMFVSVIVCQVILLICIQKERSRLNQQIASENAKQERRRSREIENINGSTVVDSKIVDV